MLPGIMSVRGSLRTMTVEDLLDWIDRRFISGTLTLEHGTTERVFGVNSGRLVGASSNVPGEHLGQLLLHRGLLDEEALNEAFKVQSETGVLLGRILIMVGAVEEHKLQDVLAHQAREAILDALTWNEGGFQFERKPPKATDLELSIELRACVEEGQRRAVDWAAIRSLIPSDDMVLTLSDTDALHRPSDDDDTTAAINRLASALARGLSVNQTVLEEHGGRFEVLSRLALLIGRGAVTVPEPTSGSADELRTAEELEGEARQRATAGRRTEALDLARQALGQAPNNPAIRELFQELERSVFAELSRDLLSDYRIPKRTVDEATLDQMNLTDVERYLAGRVDGRWDLLSLIRVAPVSAVEALITFKRLADRGLIAL